MLLGWKTPKSNLHVMKVHDVKIHGLEKNGRLKEYAEYGENLVGVTVHSKSKDEDAIWGGKMALFKVLRASSGHHVNTTSARKEHPKTLNSKRDETRRTH